MQNGAYLKVTVRTEKVDASDKMRWEVSRTQNGATLPCDQWALRPHHFETSNIEIHRYEQDQALAKEVMKQGESCGKNQYMQDIAWITGTGKRKSISKTEANSNE